MELTTEVVNITKIKDGFFLGDEATASNLDVIIQFKITHIVNAAGSQIINAWESIGIKYLTLNWSEHSNQNLFDQKDEIANRIVNFIDDSFKTGEGLLVHSLRGQNRGCIVVIIYLIKKYRWTLAKSLEFLTNKKFDVEIPKYFLNQLSFFESRLAKLGHGPRSNTWNENGNDGDIDELVIRNTYLNGLVNKNEKTPNENTKFNYPNRKISWADSNNRNLLCSVNMGKELVYQKDIKPVLSHKKMKPTKSSLKSRPGSASSDIKKSNSGVFASNKLYESINMNIPGDRNDTTNNNMTSSNQQISSSINYTDNLRFSSNELLKNYTNLYSNVSNNNEVNVSKSIGIENSSSNKKDIMPNLSHINVSSGTGNNSYNGLKQMNNINNNINSKDNTNNNSSSLNHPSSNTRPNNFALNQSNPQQRSYSLGNDPSKNSIQQPNSNSSNNSTQNNNSNQIIYASKFKNVVHNSYNNIFIQSPTGLDNIINNYESNNQNITPLRADKTQGGSNKNENSLGNNYLAGISNNYTSGNSNNDILANKGLSNSYINTPQNMQIQQQPSKLVKNAENQRLPQNNYLMGNNNVNSSINASNMMDYKNMKVIDYTTPVSNQKLQGSIGALSTYNTNISSSINSAYQQTYSSNNTLKNSNNISASTINKQGSTLNNYQPELNKKNNFNTPNVSSNSGPVLLNRPISQSTKQGPIKIQNEYEKKPSTPDNIYNNNNLSSVKLGNSLKMPSGSSSIMNPQYGTIKRSNSKLKNDTLDRPLTAPQKENDKQQNFTQQTSLKRLPSPNLKSGNITNNNMGSSQKNMSNNLGSTINIAKYRSPSPSTAGKTSTSTITIGSIKNTGGKAKWK